MAAEWHPIPLAAADCGDDREAQVCAAVIPDSAKTVGAEGCGRKATYVKVEGTWVKNAETTAK